MLLYLYQDLLWTPQNSSNNLLTVYIKFDDTFEITADPESTIIDLKDKFCKLKELNTVSIKFLKDGIELSDDDQIVCCIHGDCAFIDAFQTMAGGGWPRRKFMSEADVENMLKRKSMTEDTSSSDNDENDESEDQNKNLKENKKKDETINSCENNNLLQSEKEIHEDYKTSKTYKLPILGDKSQKKIMKQAQNNILQSPSKEELKRQNKLLREKLNIFESKSINTMSDKVSVLSKQEDKQEILALVTCNIDNCRKGFQSVFGLHKHQMKEHNLVKVDKRSLEKCNICSKMVVYIDQHLKKVHFQLLTSNICEICNKKIISNMKQHRHKCIFCPLCKYKNPKKARLLKHINLKHRKNKDVQSHPLDLTSPAKIVSTKIDQTHPSNQELPAKLKEGRALINDKNTSIIFSDKIDYWPSEGDTSEILPNNDDKLTNHLTHSLGRDLPRRSNTQKMLPVNQESITKQLSSLSPFKNSLKRKRLRYPCDIDEDEHYVSEFDEKDSPEFTSKRRKIKHILKKDLLQIDLIKARDSTGDENFLQYFKKFMQNKSNPAGREEKSDFMKDVSSVGMYTRAISNYILPVCHELIKPFDPKWFIDPTTTKNYTFGNESVSLINPQEPIYMTPKIVKSALELSKEKGGVRGGQRGTILAATIQFMNFIELHFTEHLNLYGDEALRKVVLYHQSVKNYIESTGTWKTLNSEKDKAGQRNQMRKEYQYPNRNEKILRKYTEYLGSKERSCKWEKIVKLAESNQIPSISEMLEISKFIMGEWTSVTGARPVVVYGMPLEAYVDKVPGFDPYKTTKYDCVVDETKGSKAIYRRVNPNVPPRDKACEHQLKYNSALCPKKCDKRCDPKGFNIFVTWDKTQNTNGPSYIHIPAPLKILTDLYDILRTRSFKDRQSSFTSNPNWLDDHNTPFFLNSAASPFQFLDLKALSQCLGVDVTSYDFRKIVSTWAQSHESEEVREAEEQALQHSKKIAKESYLLNKQVKPQLLTQTYIEEENIFPQSVCDHVENMKMKTNTLIKETEDIRRQKRIEDIVKEEESYKDLLSQNRPLGPRKRILTSDTKHFLQLLEEVTGEKAENYVVKMSHSAWRNYVVRLVCTAEGPLGDDLRNVWKNVYKGDLKWGVRDVRARAKADGWILKNNNLKRRDRNSWISYSLKISSTNYLKRNTLTDQ